ncbi:tripartite motif-containing protein 3-like isoform X2 [Physella acuta]|uniref:tripartite motif-containing protein 3-like isoform X2 n=1 Tax=Physella acuta TaxID=109671 RepID=UPI0027DDEE2A|nr:tripartite motif-containing protein 3-like isoform X2 [Physella acuta]
MSCYNHGFWRLFSVAGRRRILHVREIGHPEENILYTRRTIQDSISQNDSINSNVEYLDDRNSIDTSGINQSEIGINTEQQSNTAESNQRIDSSEAGIETSDSSDHNQNLQPTTVTTLTTRGPDRGDNQGENMGENICLEEKLRQFQNDNKKDEKEDTRGTYNSSHISDLEKQRRRNLIFDEERFEETFLKCLICREVYNEYDKLPKMLHCHHTFCMDCLFQMYRVEGEFRQSLTGVFRDRPMTVKIQCPTCREGVLISETELRRLPNDHTIMELLCFVSQTGKQEVQYCTKHQMQPLNFFCEPCVMPVCCDCTVIDHKESKGHVVVNVDEAMEKYTPIVEETLEDINSEKADLAMKRDSLDGAQNDLDEIQKDLTNQIRSVFDSIRQQLDDRERELYDIADSEIERKRCVLDSHMKVVVDRENQLDAVYTELERAKTDRDISLIFTGHKTARDALAKTVEIPLNTTKGFSVTFQFSSRADSSIKQQVGNLGDIIFHS